MAEQDEKQPERERETVVVEKDNKGPGWLMAVIIGVIVIFLIGWLVLGMLDTTEDTAPKPESTPTQEEPSGTEVETDIDAEVPEEETTE